MERVGLNRGVLEGEVWLVLGWEWCQQMDVFLGQVNRGMDAAIHSLIVHLDIFSSSRHDWKRLQYIER